MFKKNTNYFYAVRISISLGSLSEIFIQIGYFFKSKQKWMFFSEHSVDMLTHIWNSEHQTWDFSCAPRWNFGMCTTTEIPAHVSSWS